MIDELPAKGFGWEHLTFCNVARQEAEKLLGVESEKNAPNESVSLKEID